MPAPPMPPFEVRIEIGATDWDYVVRTMRELAERFETYGPAYVVRSGGAGGVHSVTVATRAVTVEQYQRELQEWMKNQREEDDGSGKPTDSRELSLNYPGRCIR